MGEPGRPICSPQGGRPGVSLPRRGGLDAKEVPPLGKLVDSRLGYFIRPGKHSMKLVDWQAFWDFADKQLGKP